MPNQGFLFADSYDDFFRDLKERIRSSQVKAALAVNQELVLLYWQIGQEILQRQQEEGWGTKVIDRLAQDLKIEFPAMTGFSPRNSSEGNKKGRQAAIAHLYSLLALRIFKSFSRSNVLG